MAPKEKKNVSDDPRFAGVHSDPRFYMPRKKDMKVTVDSRFKNELLTNKDFHKGSKVDKYGRKLEQQDAQLQRLYNLSDDEEDDEDEDEDDEDESEVETAAKPKSAMSALDRARGEGVDSDASSDDDDSDSESDSEVEMEEEVVLADSQDIALGDESTTLAAVNLDWDHVRSVDLMATFQGFVPPKGEIKSVAIYPSEYGKEKMAEEELNGPDSQLFEEKKRHEEEDSDDDEAIKKELLNNDDGEEINSKSFRKYQLQRMRYYYAVIVCSDVATARNIYQNCDGTEYESTANFFDLRYVPSDMTFDDEPRDKCTRVPTNYKPSDFETAALQHSKVKLTWDETPAERKNVTLRAFNKKEMDNEELKAYLASDSESDEEGRADLKAKYQSLLEGTGINKEDDDGEEDVDMEITFTPGLDEVKKAEPKEEGEETTLEKYKRKEKERRTARIQKWQETKEAREDEEEEQKPKKGKKDRKDREKKKKEMEQLALLVDEEADAKHFDMKDIIKAEKNAKKKSKYRQQGLVEDKFEMPVNDPRFTALYDDHEYAIDPSKPGFTRTKAMDKLLDERRKRQDRGMGVKRKGESGEPARKKKRKDEGEGVESLVERIKRKHKKDN
ncbi:Pre-rRNA-processing protein [Yarrowia sp. B02]|nr:Pre-rRNA-processing protein [Yarrowia sp. B02]